jgi:acetylglutamate/LysW-gamma-L-alpha-aminoadipate kinase
MTNVRGLLADPQNPDTVIAKIPTTSLDEYMHYAKGRMRKKLLGAQEALQGGVTRVCIGSESLRAVVNGSGTIIENRHLAPTEELVVIEPVREMVTSRS